MEKICDLFESVKMTILSGIFLVISFILSFNDITVPVDAAWVTVIISGIPILFSAFKKLKRNKGISRISSSLLISIAMIAAIITGDLFAAGEVAFIMAIGEILEDKTTERAKKGLKALLTLAPTQGRIIENGDEKTVPAEQIKPGDIVRILPGEAIAVDGEIISGKTSIDQSIITGESLPVDKAQGDSVFCGTINRFGAIDIRATKTGNDTSLQKLIKMVRDAEAKKAPMQRTADKWASYLVPAALLIAIIAYIVTHDITRAVTVLVVFCPCALVLATPTAIMAAIGQATKYGVIIKSGEALEKMGKTDIIAFDKTGTLTHGKLTVSDCITFADISEDELLALAASAEVKSEHPLGKAIVEYAKNNGTAIQEPKEFFYESGKGVLAKIAEKTLLCGNEKYLKENNVKISREIISALDKLRNDGKAAILIAQDNDCIGIIALSDTLRKESKALISALSKLGTSSVLLTGDNRNTALFFANQIGLSNVYAELLPEQKVDKLKEMQSDKKTVCMIGDGVNDAPALKTADVSIAMGSIGSDIAVEAADIALINDDISKISYLKRLSGETVKTIKISIFFSLFVNFMAIILSFTGILNPTTGALVHNLGAFLVILFAALLYDRKFE